jgi:hypothetical protein
MDLGVAIFNAYTYLPDHATKMWICMITVLIACIDDMVDKAEDLVHLHSFYERFASNQSQGNPVLHAVDALLRDIVCHYSSPVSNMIVTSVLDFISSIMIDNETKGMQAWYFSEQSHLRLLTPCIDRFQQGLNPTPII